MKNDLETIQELIKATQIIFNKYIRLRDKGQVCMFTKHQHDKG